MGVCRLQIEMMNKNWKMKGYWNGEPATFQVCIIKLLQDDAHPLWWQNAFVGQEIEAIEQ